MITPGSKSKKAVSAQGKKRSSHLTRGVIRVHALGHMAFDSPESSRLGLTVSFFLSPRAKCPSKNPFGNQAPSLFQHVFPRYNGLTSTGSAQPPPKIKTFKHALHLHNVRMILFSNKNTDINGTERSYCLRAFNSAL